MQRGRSQRTFYDSRHADRGLARPLHPGAGADDHRRGIAGGGGGGRQPAVRDRAPRTRSHRTRLAALDGAPPHPSRPRVRRSDGARRRTPRPAAAERHRSALSTAVAAARRDARAVVRPRPPSRAGGTPDRHRRQPSPDRLGPQHRKGVRLQPGPLWPRHHQRTRPRHRCREPRRRAGRRGAHSRRLRHGSRPLLPTRQHRPFGADPRSRWGARQRVPTRHPAVTPSFPATKSHHQRSLARRAGGRSGPEKRLAHHGALRRRARSRDPRHSGLHPLHPVARLPPTAAPGGGAGRMRPRHF